MSKFSVNSTSPILDSLWMTVFAAMICVSSICHASEGFKDIGHLPDKLSKAQDSVFMYLYEDQTSFDVGTAFLIYEDQDHYYFATNNHVLKHGCLANGQCPNSKLLQGGFGGARWGIGFRTEFLTGGWPTL